MMIGWRNQIGLLSWRILARKSRPRLKNHGDWRIEKWVVESWTHDEATKQPGHVMMVQPRFSIELFNHHDSSALTIGNHLVKMGWNALRQWIGCRKITQGAAKPYCGGQIPISQHVGSSSLFWWFLMCQIDVPNMNTAWPLATCQCAGWSPKQFDPLKGPK